MVGLGEGDEEVLDVPRDSTSNRVDNRPTIG